MLEPLCTVLVDSSEVPRCYYDSTITEVLILRRFEVYVNHFGLYNNMVGIMVGRRFVPGVKLKKQNA